MYTTVDIDKGDSVIEYVGELVDEITYHAALNNIYMMELGKEDATHEGRPTKVFINPFHRGNLAQFLTITACPIVCRTYSTMDSNAALLTWPERRSKQEKS